MSGIIGIVGKTNVAPLLVESSGQAGRSARRFLRTGDP